MEALGLTAREYPREAEVDQLEVALLVDQDVLGLNVTVDHIVVVDVVDSLKKLEDNAPDEVGLGVGGKERTSRPFGWDCRTSRRFFSM